MNNIQIFNSEQFGRVRVIMSDNEPKFIAKDVCEILGISKYRDALSRLDPDEGCIVRVDTPGGKQEMRALTESGLYTLIIRSDKQEAKPFRKWVTSEVLPAIRKTGGYMAAKEMETPATIIARAVLVANDTIARQKQQLEQVQKQVAALAPKAELMDKVLDTDQKIDVGQAAKILNLPFGRNTLFQRLRERGIFFCNRNEPKQEYINRGYFELKEKLIDRNNHESFTVIKVLVTQKGLDFLARQFEVVQTPKKMTPIK